MVEVRASKLEITPDLSTFKPRLDQILTASISEFQETNINKDSPLKRYTDYVKEMAIKGKGIRPFLGYLTYKAFGGNKNEEAMKSLIPLELFHMFSLILDDVSDNGIKRRGMDALHVYIAKDLMKKNPNLNHDERGKSIAIITGNLLFHHAHELINQDPNLDEETRKKTRIYFGNLVNNTAQGQVLDIELPIYDSVPTDLIDEKNLLKTASVITGSMLIGATLAKQDTPEAVEFCKNFGLNLGMIYQMQDDILDTQDVTDSEKTSLRDIAERTHTHLTQHVAENGTEKQQSILSKNQGVYPTEETGAEIREVFDKSGAIRAVKELIKQHAEEAKAAIDNLNLDKERKEGFYRLLSTISKRTN